MATPADKVFKKFLKVFYKYGKMELKGKKFTTQDDMEMMCELGMIVSENLQILLEDSVAFNGLINTIGSQAKKTFWKNGEKKMKD